MSLGAPSSSRTIIPFFETKALCSMCATVGLQPEMKFRLYVERDRDVDLRPKTYLWAIKDLQVCHPPLYYMWRCSGCGFTASHSHFLDPAKHFRVGLASLKQRFENVKQISDWPKIYAILSAGTTVVPRSFSAGMGLYLLAIHQLDHVQELITKETLTLAGYYLRLAWLFRDLKDSKQSEAPSVERMLFQVKPLWPEVPTSEKMCLERAATMFEQGLETSSAIQTTRDEVELLLLIARIYMQLGDPRKAKNLGAYSREKLSKYEEEIERESKRSPSTTDTTQVKKLKMMQSQVLEMLADPISEQK